VSSNVAVALVTALATLGGVAVTGTITVLTSRLQIRDQNAKERRQLRRDTYVAFLNESTLLDSKLQEFWEQAMRSAPQLEELSAMVKDGISKMLKPMDGQLTLVTLEGPDNVAEAARDLHIAKRLKPCTL
jgi:hypothetical protein